MGGRRPGPVLCEEAKRRPQIFVQMVRGDDDWRFASNPGSLRCRRLPAFLRNLRYVVLRCSHLLCSSRSSSHGLPVTVFVADSKAVAALAFKKRCEEDQQARQEEKKRKFAKLFCQEKNHLAVQFKKELDDKAGRGISLKFADLEQAQLQTVTKDDISNQWCRAFAACGVSPFVLRNSEFKKAMQMTRDHGKDLNWQPPTDKAMMTTHLDTLDQDVRAAYILCTVLPSLAK